MLFPDLTKHAIARMQQRGKNLEGIKMILRYGKRYSRHYDGVFLRRKEAAREIKRRRGWLARLEARKSSGKIIRAMRRRVKTLEKMRGCVVVEKNQKILTTYNYTRRHKRR